MTQIKHQGVYRTLIMQLDKLYRHNWQGSFRTKQRYYEACKRFCAYLADTYRLQKLENISAKHLVNYVLHLLETGMADFGMNPTATGHTNPGGEHMNETQITFGPVTYEISRVYTGDRTASQLVAEQLSQRILETSAFDEEAEYGV